MDGLTAIVVVPARDEQEHVAACLQALAAQSVGAAAFEVIVVLDACEDDTESVVKSVTSHTGLAVTTIAGPAQGSGPARRVGMDEACARLLALNLPEALIATTDADSRPAADWLERQLAHRDAGASVIAGRIELDPAEAAQLPAVARRVRERDAATRLHVVRRGDPDAAHHHFAGASLAVTAATYRAAGGLGTEPALEDEAFAQRLAAQGIPVLRAADVVVTTSARADGRATRGLSVDLAVAGWLARRRLRAADYDLETLRGLRDPRRGVTVIIPTLECADTVGGVLDRAVRPVREAGVVDEVVVVDAASRDGTAQIAAAHGARVVQQDAIAPELGPALGKGDAMWRALQVTGGELVCFMDGDTGDPQPAHLIGLVGPLLADPSIAMVRGAFTRPFADGGRVTPDEGGRVTELIARPLINMHAPLLAGFGQPLAGEFAACRDLLEEIPFPAGYGVEIATLLDGLQRRGLDALAECDLGSRQNRHQPLRALGEMAYAVLAAMERRLPGTRSPISGRYVRPWEDGRAAAITVVERPPLRALRTPNAEPATLRAGVGER